MDLDELERKNICQTISLAENSDPFQKAHFNNKTSEIYKWS